VVQDGRSQVRFPMVSFEFSIYVILHYGSAIDSASNRNEYQEYFLGSKGGWCIGLATLPHSCASCYEIWEPQPPGTLWACPGITLPFYLCGANVEIVVVTTLSSDVYHLLHLCYILIKVTTTF